MPAVSLILTVKNEAAALPRLLESIASQTLPPAEVIVADGGSTDNTKQILEQFASRLNLILLDCPGTNISQGRNLAIAHARHALIASTDAGVRLDPRWLEEITAPFEQRTAPSSAVVAGFFLPDPHGAFETALAATTLPALRDIQPEKFLPSSRSIAFRRAAWQAVGGYPEWLDYSEDIVFDLALYRAGYHFLFAPRACVYFRPRAHLRQFAWQYYLYARGDGKANLWIKRHTLRYLTYLIGLPLSLAIFSTMPQRAVAIWIVSAAAMFWTPYRRLATLWCHLTLVEKLVALAFVPIIRLTGDIAKMVGYPVGVWWSVQNRR